MSSSAEGSSSEKLCFACFYENKQSVCRECPLTRYFSQSNLCDLQNLAEEIGSVKALRETVGNVPEAGRDEWVANKVDRIYRSMEMLEKVGSEPFLDRVGMTVYSSCKAEEEKEEILSMAESGPIGSLPLKSARGHLELSQLAFEAAKINLNSLEVSKKLELLKLNAAIAAASKDVENEHEAIIAANEHLREVECDALAADKDVIDAKASYEVMKYECEKLFAEE